ncbi:hypothetical protein IM043_gp130 [Bacillus phage SPG24]|nr:hypothetical protein IM043_gp130 [Bacillus phage SPG24]
MFNLTLFLVYRLVDLKSTPF